MVRPTNKNTHVAGAGAIVAGKMFKTNRAWFLAAQSSRPGEIANWVVQAYDTAGHLRSVTIWSDEVEYAHPGYVPSSMRSASVLRAASKLEEKAHGMLSRVGTMRNFASMLKKVGL